MPTLLGMLWETIPTAPCVRPVRRTVVFSDVVRSTALLDEHGDAAWLDIVDRHTRAVGAAATAHGGEVNNFMGDGFMLVFDRPADAVACAIRLQRESAEQGPLELRIGIDHGEVYSFRDSWLVGLTIHVASRLTELCPAGGVAVSDRVASVAGEVLPHRSVESHLVAIRGLTEPCVVHLVDPGEFTAVALGHPSATPIVSNTP